MAEETNGRGSPTLIRDLPQSDRPRERLRDAGAEALSAAELLAILLRTGNAKESALAQASRVLAKFGGLTGLARASFSELCNEHGLGEAKAAQIKAALQMGIRAAAGDVERAVLRSPEQVAELLCAEMSLLEQEEVRVLLLDTRNRLMAIHKMYRGSVHTTHVRVAELLREAIRANAPAMIVVHNHPSGDPTPSAADLQMSKTLFDSGKLMDVDVLDHMVMAGGKHSSIRGILPGYAKP
jgi:DNA repair protein RadC